MNILLVVPFHDDLPLLPSEARTLASLLKPRRVLTDKVTEDWLASVIDQEVHDNGPFDGIWIATHSSGEAIQLSDVAVSRDRIVQYVLLSGAHWVVLNGCEGEGIANSINAVGVDVATTMATVAGTGIDDHDALLAAKRLAQGLQDSDGDLEAAFDSLGDLPGQHRFYSAISARRTYNDKNLEVSIARLEEKVDNLSKQMVNNMIISGAISLAIIFILFFLHSRGLL